MIRGYLFALDPTAAQAQGLRSHCGAQRYAYNFGLALVIANLNQRAAERSYGIPEHDLTPAVSWSAFGLRRVWNEAKHDRAPWWAENSKEAYSSGLANLATALSNWSASKSCERAGRKVAFPRFKGRRARLTCRFTTGTVPRGAVHRTDRAQPVPPRSCAGYVASGPAHVLAAPWTRPTHPR
ncbi:MAG TPA: helix-turn-helix domain-containing protein [Pseudonocardiaceae bacterium]|nr:helix-turn-helix domain-containing protein [Pseudonocardiaceae bacterium]